MEYKIRNYPLFSACGLNCGLCPRYHTDGTSKCPGCAGEDFLLKHPVCGVLSCCQRRELEYCCLCEEYPCKKYDNADCADSFITHMNQFKDFEKAKSIGLEAYEAELNKKLELLKTLLERYDNGRCKSFFCIAVNLLSLQDVEYAMKQIAAELNLYSYLYSSKKELSVAVIRIFQEIADKRGVALQLRKKTKKL